MGARRIGVLTLPEFTGLMLGFLGGVAGLLIAILHAPLVGMPIVAIAGVVDVAIGLRLRRRLGPFNADA